MNKFIRETLKVRILKLAEFKCAGPPAELALRFEISERTIKHLVKEIRVDGNDIRYSRVRISYETGKNYQQFMIDCLGFVVCKYFRFFNAQ